MIKAFRSISLALAISIATAWVEPATDERALYGSEGPMERNWLPRTLAGWPAPFLADDPGTSVMHEIGAEDTFRPGPFTATLSFWILVVRTIHRLICRVGGVQRWWQSGRPVDTTDRRNQKHR